MKNSIRHFLFIFAFLSCMFATSTVLANKCQTDQLDEIKKQLNQASNDACNAFISAASDYNSRAGSYVSSCNSSLTNESPALPPSDDMTAAKAAGTDISDSNLYKYNGIPWSGENPEDAACLQKLQETQKAYQAYRKAYNNMLHRVQATKNPSVGSCSCDENGQNPMCVSLNKTSEEKADQDGDCPPVQTFQNMLSNCPLCSIFRVVLQTDADLANVAWTGVAKPLSEIVGIFFLVLLAIEALKSVASMGGLKISSYLKSVLLTSLKIAITVLMLSNMHYIYDLFISPVITGGMELGLTIAQSGGGDFSSSEDAGAINSQGIDPALFDKIMATVRNFGTAASTTPAVGMSLICNSWPSGWFSTPKIGMFLSGLIILLFGFMIWLAMSFYLIDCSVQLGMLCALVPLLIACWPFRMTQTYTTKGVKMMMNTFFNFTLMGVILMMAIQIINFALSGGGQFSFNDLVTALNNGNIDELEKISSLDGVRTLILIACCIFSMKLIAKVSALADQFSPGAGMAIGAEMGGLAVAAATNTAKKAASSAGRVSGKSIYGMVAGRSGLTGTAQDTVGALDSQWQQSWAEGSQNRIPTKRQPGSGDDGIVQTRPAASLTEGAGNAINGAMDQVGGGHAEDAGDKEILAAATMGAGGAGAGAGAGGASAGAGGASAGGASAGAGASGGAGAGAGGAGAGASGGAQMQNMNATPSSAQPSNPQGRENSTLQSGGNDNIQQHNFKTSTDQNGNEITKDYDQNGKLRMESTKGKDGSTSTKTFDENGKLQSERMEDAQGNGHNKTYGKDGKLTSETQWSKDGEITHTDYANNGQSMSRTYNVNDLYDKAGKPEATGGGGTGGGSNAAPQSGNPSEGAGQSPTTNQGNPQQPNQQQSGDDSTRKKIQDALDNGNNKKDDKKDESVIGSIFQKMTAPKQNVEITSPLDEEDK